MQQANYESCSRGIGTDSGPNSTLRHFSELLYVLVTKELKVRYKNSVLGYLWALANPFAFAIVYYVAFKVIMRVQMPNYSVFLLTAMFPWMWFANSIVHATGSYRNNASLIKRVALHRAVLPLSNVVHEFVHFCFALPVLMLFILITGNGLHVSWLWWLPLLAVLQLTLVYPIALMFALANVFIHDIEYMVGIGLSMLFFLTPIVYSLSMVPEAYQWYFQMSPVSVLMESWRSVLLHGELNASSIAYVAMWSVVLGILSSVLFRRTQAKLGELL